MIFVDEMNEWMNEYMHEWINERKNSRLDLLIMIVECMHYLTCRNIPDLDLFIIGPRDSFITIWNASEGGIIKSSTR